jgi:hypothetical protein
MMPQSIRARERRELAFFRHLLDHQSAMRALVLEELEGAVSVFSEAVCIWRPSRRLERSGAEAGSRPLASSLSFAELV